MHAPYMRMISDDEARAALKRFEQFFNADIEIEHFTDRVMAAWPDFLRNYQHFRDTEDIKQLHMFFLGMQYGMETVGRRGGLARTKTMSPRSRSLSARKAAKARWAKS